MNKVSIIKGPQETFPRVLKEYLDEGWKLESSGLCPSGIASLAYFWAIVTRKDSWEKGTHD